MHDKGGGSKIPKILRTSFKYRPSRQFPSLGGPIGILKFISLSWLTAVPHTISGVKSTESITCSARRLSSSLSLWILAARSYEGEIILPLCLKIDYWPHATNYFHHVLSHRIGVFIVASLVHGDTCPMTYSAYPILPSSRDFHALMCDVW